MDQDGAELIVRWFLDVERRLADLLATIPLRAETEAVFVPPLASIIVETCSLTDVIFRDYFSPSRPRVDIRDFASFFEKEYSLSGVRSLLYQHPVRLLRPFARWEDLTADPVSPDWWRSYNSLKHDRVSNFNLSTLGTAVSAVCATHVLISSIGDFYEAAQRHELLFGRGDNEQKQRETFKREVWYQDIPEVMFETRLFGTPCARRFPEALEFIDREWYSGGDKFRRYVTGRPRPV